MSSKLAFPRHNAKTKAKTNAKTFQAFPIPEILNYLTSQKGYVPFSYSLSLRYLRLPASSSLQASTVHPSSVWEEKIPEKTMEQCTPPAEELASQPRRHPTGPRRRSMLDRRERAWVSGRALASGRGVELDHQYD